jgi:hypothetical protein
LVNGRGNVGASNWTGDCYLVLMDFLLYMRALPPLVKIGTFFLKCRHHCLLCPHWVLRIGSGS